MMVQTESASSEPHKPKTREGWTIRLETLIELKFLRSSCSSCLYY